MLVRCISCNKEINRPTGRVNEAKKFGWNSYCSKECQSKFKNLCITTKCYRSDCDKVVTRCRNQFRKFGVAFCSRRCAALVNNKKYPRERGITKICIHCSNPFKSRKKYCSLECKNNDAIIPQGVLLGKIKEFFSKEGRIPFKNEIGNYHAIRSRFGSWNKAIKAAGLKPNPVMFANRHIAKDGHECDSLAEMIIDDWMFARKIAHKRRVYYPGNNRLTADFMIGNVWIEFFGLFGNHERYDQLRKLKLKTAKIHKLKLIGIYPKDLFPENKLAQVLSSCIHVQDF